MRQVKLIVAERDRIVRRWLAGGYDASGAPDVPGNGACQVGLGLSNREIGLRLRITEGTVKVHVHNILRKTNLQNRTSLALSSIVQEQDSSHRER
jgi:hypothetical protein